LKSGNLLAAILVIINLKKFIEQVSAALNHSDHVSLIAEGVTDKYSTGENPDRPIWADFGSGAGAFTLALADLLGPKSLIFSIDKDRSAIQQQESAMRTMFPSANVHYRVANFSKPLDLPSLDGIVMANSLHFTPRHLQQTVITQLKHFLKPDGRLILVEYNSDSGNLWVPYPISYPAWEILASKCGFKSVRLLKTVPSRFLKEIYSTLNLE
jgi:SAM-dependent methyltransferase